MRPDAEFGGLIVQNTWRHCRVLRHVDQVIDIRNGTDSQTLTALQNLVQSLGSSRAEDDDDSVSIQLLKVGILYGCYVRVVTLVSE